MKDAELLEAIEKYLNGEMTENEKAYLEQLRSTHPDVDQMVVEHHLFLNQLEQFAHTKQFKENVHLTHNRLLEQGVITQDQPLKTGKLVYFWNRYKRTITVAASIACITALTISGMLSYFSPRKNVSETELLNRVKVIEHAQNIQKQRIEQLDVKIEKAPKDLQQRSIGTSFLIDGKGYLVTNSHVVNDASRLVVVNNGKEYYAKNVYNDAENDIAILKIDDPDYTPLPTLPYSIRKTNADLGEEIFTMGYPRDEIVYGRGYLSAISGFNNDTLSVQISVDANRGNSGGPVFDKNGDIIGILNSREINANSVVFANKANNIYKAIDKLKDEDSSYRHIKLPLTNTLKNKERTQQIKQMSNCVFMVKGYYK